MKTVLSVACFLALAGLFPGCGGGSTEVLRRAPLSVNSVDDDPTPRSGVVTLRSALARARSGQKIMFDPSLDGATITLSIVGEEHSVLRGEVMGIKDEPSGPVSYLVGYEERDYGASALYSKRDVEIDASDLPHGITVAWDGAEPARVLAVYGDLTMTNVTVTGGRSEAVDISVEAPDQLWTLGRGGGVAVWGVATLTDCTVHDNHCVGDYDSSRDRGAFGGGVYANIVRLTDCEISGNTVVGGGAAGGGVFSVTGARDLSRYDSVIERCSISGNRISALFTYGGGVYSDGGGIGNSNTLYIRNSTIARNLVEPAALPPFLLGMGYWRGGGVYMSNGSLTLTGCTIVENEVHGWPRTDTLDRANLAGGVAGTIGNAHATEYMTIGQSIIAGNTVTELSFGPPATYDHDIFTGTLFQYRSRGHNRIGVIDFSQMLVPVGVSGWSSLCRRHYPKIEDRDGVAVADVLDLAGGVTTSVAVTSRGVDDGGPAVLWYLPAGIALDHGPDDNFDVEEFLADYFVSRDGVDDFTAIMLSRLESRFGPAGFAADFTDAFEAYLRSVDLDDEADGLQPYTDPEGEPIYTLAAALWFGPADTWPKEVPNHPWIEFWHHLDQELALNVPSLGPEVLGDALWDALFDDGDLVENDRIDFRIQVLERTAVRLGEDQLGTVRTAGTRTDIGAIEVR